MQRLEVSLGNMVHGKKYLIEMREFFREIDRNRGDNNPVREIAIFDKKLNNIALTKNPFGMYDSGQYAFYESLSDDVIKKNQTSAMTKLVDKRSDANIGKDVSSGWFGGKKTKNRNKRYKRRKTGTKKNKKNKSRSKKR
jgi:hypothetical protein